MIPEAHFLVATITLIWIAYIIYMIDDNIE